MFRTWGADFLVTLMLVNASSKKMCLSFEITQNKQQYGTKITCTEARKMLR